MGIKRVLLAALALGLILIVLPAWRYEVRALTSYRLMLLGEWRGAASLMRNGDIWQPRGHKLLIVCYDRLELPALKLRQARQLVREMPYSYFAYRSIVDSYHQLGRSDRAYKWVQRGLEQVPNDPVLTRALAILAEEALPDESIHEVR